MLKKFGEKWNNKMVLKPNILASRVFYIPVFSEFKITFA